MPSADVIPISPGFIKAHSPLPPVNAYAPRRITRCLVIPVRLGRGEGERTLVGFGHPQIVMLAPFIFQAAS